MLFERYLALEHVVLLQPEFARCLVHDDGRVNVVANTLQPPGVLVWRLGFRLALRVYEVLGRV